MNEMMGKLWFPLRAPAHDQRLELAAWGRLEDGDAICCQRFRVRVCSVRFIKGNIE